ncbi:Amidase [Teratosphaeria destructans]|uniref:Amidase n=1 Tax=Teratosphaeria destructans TaxID=418781 RepID=A0A9W7SNG6_9PEZI|nr:Amidase [Teratosphaeria destructans]
MNARRADMAATVRNLWVERALDGILMPAYQGTAAPHDRYGSPMYTVLANLLEYPALTIPYLHADATLDADYRRDDVVYTPSCAFAPFPDQIPAKRERKVTDTLLSADVPEQCEGMPTGFQLLGRPHKDEELVAMAPVVLEALGVSGW